LFFGSNFGVRFFGAAAPTRGEVGESDLVILQKKVAGLTEGTLDRFVLRARKAVGLRGRVNVLVTSSASVRSLNHQFRGKNKATDVLSFPAASDSESGKAGKLAGDVAISADIAVQNSVRLGHAVSAEIKILVLHGILHLAGFDHESDNGEMARTEATLRRKLRLPVALIERVQSTRVELAKRRSATIRRGTGRATGARRMA
jgi:probable rRNA maturation factor